VVRACGRPRILRGAALDTLIAGSALSRSRSIKAAAIALCVTLSPVIAYGAGYALLHATLLRSVPTANSVLKRPPESVRLVFSEAVVPELSQIILVRRSEEKTVIDSLLLPVANDPHDVHTLVGRVGELPNGRYKVIWRVLSADGHPVSGNFSFVVGTGNPASIAPTESSTAFAARDSERRDTMKASASTPATTDTRSIPVLASILRGTGLGALMAGLGLLFFGVTAGERRSLAPRSVVVRLIAIGATLLVVHMIAWLQNISPTGSLSSDFIASVLGSTVGRIEVIRVALALLTLWAISLARHDVLALILGGACLLVSGAVGHPAAIHPSLSVPAKIAHLLSASLWLGGLLWLVWLSRCDDAACRKEASRVSSVALITVILIFLTGVVESILFLNSPGDLIHSPYGRLVVAKAAGLAILVGYGAYNRFGLLPHLESQGTMTKLSRSARQELIVVTVVILIGGFLAYVPTPPTPTSSLSSFTGRSQ
jgi:copper transport protein